MCLFLCTYPKLQQLVSEAVVRRERDTRLDEVFLSRRNRWKARRSESPMRKIRISFCDAAEYHAASYNQASFYEGKNLLDLFADAWNRLLVLLGWRC